jgi:hypothetical protein
MHRSGTSVVARGLRALSVTMGDNLFETQPDNPTGYWEDRAIVEINQRMLEILGLKWDDVSPIANEGFEHYRIRLLELAALRYFKSAFPTQPLWGFKDPRAIRLLPFWLRTMRRSDAADAYVVVIRNPRSVAASLFRRQEIDPIKARRLWLVHMIPYLHECFTKPSVVVDYDLLMSEPRRQLERIAQRINLPSPGESSSREIDRFATGFLDENLRHNAFAPNDLDATTAEARLTRAAYLLLHQLATDRLEPEALAFGSAWQGIRSTFDALVPFDRHPDSSHPNGAPASNSHSLPHSRPYSSTS